MKESRIRIAKIHNLTKPRACPRTFDAGIRLTFCVTRPIPNNMLFYAPLEKFSLTKSKNEQEQFSHLPASARTTPRRRKAGLFLESTTSEISGTCSATAFDHHD